MKKVIFIFGFFAVSLLAELRVVTSYEYIKSIVEIIGEDRVKVESLSSPTFDPHFIVPKPSLISKVRRADLLIKNGAELEDAWLIALQKRAGNRDVIIGGKGFLELSRSINLVDIPTVITRRGGDIHSCGNPHFHLSPKNIEIVAERIAEKLSELDPANRLKYSSSLNSFLEQWKRFISQLQKRMEPFKGSKVVTYHQLYNYFLYYFEVELLATLEPIPGIAPSIGDVSDMLLFVEAEKPILILQDVYNSQKFAEYLTKKSGVPYFVTPHDVGATPDSGDIFKLFNSIVKIFEASR